MTYSIIGRDDATGELGIAVESRYFAAGRIVPWLEAGVGAVASQAFVNPAYGHKGIDLLREGASPSVILEMLTAEDPDADIRQVGIMNADGHVAAFTGARCVTYAGHVTGQNCVAQANMCSGEVWLDMVRAFESSTGTLAERLLAALTAAEYAGGDLRGSQAASLIVVASKSSGVAALDRIVDLRIDDHPDPINELTRLLAYDRALAGANSANDLAFAGQFADALAILETCVAAFPGDPEFLSGRAIALACLGRIGDARRDAAACLDFAPGWREYFLEMSGKGLIPLAREQASALLP
jgi:uncharacterized Ntn-hydrolase superfamily protein